MPLEMLPHGIEIRDGQVDRTYPVGGAGLPRAATRQRQPVPEAYGVRGSAYVQATGFGWLHGFPAQRHDATIEVPSVITPRKCKLPRSLVFGESLALYNAATRQEADVALDLQRRPPRLSSRDRQVNSQTLEVAFYSDRERRGRILPAARKQNFGIIVGATGDDALERHAELVDQAVGGHVTVDSGDDAEGRLA